MQVYYGLYADSGDLYSGDGKQSLMASVAQHANQADRVSSREVAAARYAATGDLATARVRMVNATPNDFFLSFAARKKIWEKGAAARQALMREKGMKTPLKMPTGQDLQGQINNSLWINGTDALNWAGGDPEIRAGVLRLLLTIPQVTVANSTTDGQSTLTITAGSTVFGSGRAEVLTVNATTGMPVSSVFDYAWGAGGRGDLPGLPGDAGWHRGRQVLSTMPYPRAATRPAGQRRQAES